MKVGTDFVLKFNEDFYSIKFGKDLWNSFNCVFFLPKSLVRIFHFVILGFLQ